MPVIAQAHLNELLLLLPSPRTSNHLHLRLIPNTTDSDRAPLRLQCREGLDANLKLAPTYYCGRKCQTTDWNDHKKFCKLANDRKVLKRVAIFLLNTFCAIRVVAFDVKIEKVEVKAGKIHVYEGRYEEEDILVEFPEKYPSDWSPLSGDDLRALWTWCACSDALFTMNKMVESALKGFAVRVIRLSRANRVPGVCSRVQEMRLAVDPSKNRIIMHGLRSQAELKHEVFCVTLRDGEQYALDLTGAQYGQYRPVMRWTTCMRVLDATLVETSPLGTAVARREGVFRYLSETTAKGPIQDQSTRLALTLYSLADIFSISFFTKPRLESNPEVEELLMRLGGMSMEDTGALAKLLRGNDDECLEEEANYLATNAVMDAKAFAKLIGSYGGIHRLPEGAAVRYFDIRDSVLKGRNLQAELRAGVQVYKTGVVSREQDIQAALRAALDEGSTQEEYMVGAETATKEKGKIQNKFGGETSLIALE
ncbi:hypothetical protein LTR10_010373 [Elasticomyces elasticus]|nr:hypothetical protein LTR10_010373 [Elasticomyces elasticus]KAK4972275.1 hypothetical protein LTR42_006782 [Elasticomyces elasticus]